MKFKILSLNDYMENADLINGWFEDISRHSGGEFTPDVIRTILSRGSHQGLGWITDDDDLVGIIVSTVVEYSTYRCLSIVGAAGAAGGQAGYDQAHQIFNLMAIKMECSRFEFKGRRGFAKKFKNLGWKEKYTVYECETVNNVTPIGGEEPNSEHGSIRTA